MERKTVKPMKRQVPKDHEYDETGQCKWCEHEDSSKASFAAPTGSPAPSWANFCEHIRQVWPEMIPDAKDAKWTNLYTVYEIGYGACLLHMQNLLEQENR